MELKDYIYLFGKELLETSVSETISIENWEGNDFDIRYIEYDQIYTKTRDKYIEMDEAEVIDALRHTKSKILDNFYSIMQKNLLASLRDEKSISDNEFEKIVIQLDSMKDLENFNKEFIEKIRDFEEEII